MFEERVSLTTTLLAQAEVTRDKHRAGEQAGREILPAYLSSADGTRDFFDEGSGLGGRSLGIFEKMCLPQAVRRALPDLPPNESLAVLAGIAADGEGLKARVAESLLEGITLKAGDRGKEIVPQILKSHTALSEFLEETEASGGLPRPLVERMFSPEVFARSLQQVPPPEVMAVLIEELSALDRSEAGTALAIMEGLFKYPRWLFEQKTKDRHRARANLQQATRASIGLLYNFAWAVALNPSPLSRERALDFYRRTIFNPDELSVFDFAGTIHYLSESEIEQYLPQSTAAVILLESLIDQTMDRKENLERVEALVVHDTDVAHQLRRFSKDTRIKTRVDAESLELLRRVEESRSYLRAVVEEATGEIQTFIRKPQKEPLLNEAIRLRLETLAEKFLGDWAECFLIDQPGGVKQLVSFDRLEAKEVAEGVKHLVDGTFQGSFLDKPKWTNRLSSREIEAIIRLLGPGFSTEQLSRFCEDNYESLLKTSVSIPEVGREVPLRLDEEQWLREMGLKRILIDSSGDGGYLITFDFGNYSYPVALDKNLLLTEAEQAAFPEMVGHLSDNSQLHLLALSYSYLDSLLHPKRQGQEILGARKKGRKGQPEIMTTGETRDYLGGTTFLRALPLGQKCLRIENEEANQRVKDRFGYSLGEIWAAFLNAQADRRTLEALRESKPGLWGKVTLLFDKNLEAKADEIEWVEDEGKMVMRIKGASKVLGQRDRQLEAKAAELLGIPVDKPSDKERLKQDLFDYRSGICYEVTAVLCEESLERKSVVCPKAAARIAVGMAGSAPN